MLPARVAIRLALDDNHGSRDGGLREDILPVERGAFAVAVPEGPLLRPQFGPNDLTIGVVVGDGDQRVPELAHPLLDPGAA